MQRTRLAEQHQHAVGGQAQRLAGADGGGGVEHARVRAQREGCLGRQSQRGGALEQRGLVVQRRRQRGDLGVQLLALLRLAQQPPQPAQGGIQRLYGLCVSPKSAGRLQIRCGASAAVRLCDAVSPSSSVASMVNAGLLCLAQQPLQPARVDKTGIGRQPGLCAASSARQ